MSLIQELIAERKKKKNTELLKKISDQNEKLEDKRKIEHLQGIVIRLQNENLKQKEKAIKLKEEKMDRLLTEKEKIEKEKEKKK